MPHAFVERRELGAPSRRVEGRSGGEVGSNHPIPAPPRGSRVGEQTPHDAFTVRLVDDALVVVDGRKVEEALKHVVWLKGEELRLASRPSVQPESLLDVLAYRLDGHIAHPIVPRPE